MSPIATVVAFLLLCCYILYLSMHNNYYHFLVCVSLCSVDLNAADTGVQLKTTVVSPTDRKPGSAEAKREGQCNC